MALDTNTITHTDFVTIFVKDLPEAQEFYGNVLGLPRSNVFQRGEAPPIGAEYETGNLTLGLLDAAAIGREFEPSSHPIALRVDDVAEARAKLESSGVNFIADDIDSGVCNMAFFEDPHGNMLMLHHRYAPVADPAP